MQSIMSKSSTPPPTEPPIIASVFEALGDIGSHIISFGGPDIDRSLHEQLLSPGPVLIQISVHPPLFVSQLLTAVQIFKLDSYPSWQLHVKIVDGLRIPVQNE